MKYLLLIGAIVYFIGEVTRPVYCVSAGLPQIITQVMMLFIGMIGGAYVLIELWAKWLNSHKGE